MSSLLEKNSKKELIKLSSSVMMLSRALKRYNLLNVHLDTLGCLVLVLSASLGLCQNRETHSFQATDLVARVEIQSPTQDQLASSKPQSCKEILRNWVAQKNQLPIRPVS